MMLQAAELRLRLSSSATPSVEIELASGYLLFFLILIKILFIRRKGFKQVMIFVAAYRE